MLTAPTARSSAQTAHHAIKEWLSLLRTTPATHVLWDDSLMTKLYPFQAVPSVLHPAYPVVFPPLNALLVEKVLSSLSMHDVSKVSLSQCLLSTVKVRSLNQNSNQTWQFCSIASQHQRTC